MLTALIIAAATCALLVAVIFTKPSVTVHGKTHSIYWAVPLAGAVATVATGTLSLGEIAAGITASGEINPIKILLLFLSMTFMSVYLDEAGFFVFLASFALKKAKKSQKALFFYLYITVSVLTVFTSNDIIVLTFTPFICYFAKNAKINPLPYLICEFVAANTWSMALIIGNPTNIYLATSGGISFAEYLSAMIIPTLFAGVASYIALYLIFRKQLALPMSVQAREEKIKDKFATLVGLVHLSLCIVLLAISSYIGLPMWAVSLIFAGSLLAVDSVDEVIEHKKFSILINSFKRAPWETVPFVLSMFVIVLALDKTGATAEAARLLARGHDIFYYGVGSFLCANVINNIPMSVLFSSIINSAQTSADSLYAAIIGSNLGAFLTPAGALAGIMWTGMLRHHGVSLSFKRFSFYGVLIAIPTLAFALLGLFLV